MPGGTKMAGSKGQKKKSNTTSSNRSNSSAKKGSSQRKSIRVTEGSGNKKEIIAIIVIGVCLLLIISLFGGAGVFGKLLQNIMLGFFGGIPACFIIIAVVADSVRFKAVIRRSIAASPIAWLAI